MEDSKINFTNIYDHDHVRIDYDLDHVHDNRKREDLLFFMDCLVNALVLLFNISLILLILIKQKLRKQLFYIRVLTLCFSDLIVGAIVLPFGISYMHDFAWLHGHKMCQVYVVLDITHFGFSALVITSLCLDRFLTKILELHPDRFQVIKRIQIILFILPCVFTLCVFLPLLLSSIAMVGVVMEHICGLIIRDNMVVPTAVVAYLVPTIVMIVTTAGMLILYYVKRPVWYQLPDSEEAGDTNSAMNNSRSSMIATLMVSSVTVLFWFPYLVNIFIMATCRMASCYPSLEVFKITLLLSTLSSLFTPCLWVADDQIRVSIKEVISRVRLFCSPHIVREQQYMEQMNEDDL